MSKNINLILGMIEQCRTIIDEQESEGSNLPKPLQRKHLLWLCKKLDEKVEVWPDAKIHRWLGFIQCAMIANMMIDLPEAKSMFDEVKQSFKDTKTGILDPMHELESLYNDIGGEG